MGEEIIKRITQEQASEDAMRSLKKDKEIQRQKQILLEA